MDVPGPRAAPLQAPQAPRAEYVSGVTTFTLRVLCNTLSRIAIVLNTPLHSAPREPTSRRAAVRAQELPAHPLQPCSPRHAASCWWLSSTFLKAAARHDPAHVLAAVSASASASAQRVRTLCRNVYFLIVENLLCHTADASLTFSAQLAAQADRGPHVSERPSASRPGLVLLPRRRLGDFGLFRALFV